MRSFCATGLILLVSFGWTASQANAESGSAAPSLLPLPSTSPIEAISASYSSDPLTVEPYGSSFATPRQIAPAEPNQTPTAFEESLHHSGWDDGGCDEGCCGPNCCGNWFGGIGGLAMGRNRPNPYWTTFETNVNTNQLLNTQNAGANWTGGGQVTVGYGFGGCGGCGTCGSCGGCGYLGPGIAFTYWGLGQMNGFASIRDPNNNLSTPINLDTQFGPVLIGARPASDFFDNSREHRISREDRVNNFELNLLQGGWTVGRLQVVALVGFRYFRFDERLSFGAVAGGSEFGDNGGANEAYLAFRCTNNLYGAQVGSLLNYMVTDRFGVFLVPKAGIYGNQMNCRSQLYTGDSQVGFDIPSHKADVAFLGEIDTGLSYAFTNNLRAFIGYRVVGVANVALADNQFLPFLADTSGFAQVKQSGSLILHGGFAGLGWTF